jgi:ParB-like chromosome segregation protein Spo0J
VSGHHRVEAAVEAGLDEVPCWVRDMDDNEAFMTLVLGNTQGELSALEVGVHALRAVPLAQGSRSGGGVSEHARRIGYGEESVRQWRKAAEVWSSLPKTFWEVSQRHQHLYEISKAPREVWPTLVQVMLDRGWTVTDTQSVVQRLRQFEVPDEWQTWLKPGTVLARFLKDQRFDPGRVARIVRAADGALKWIADNAEPTDADEFVNWLHRQGEDSWDHKKIDAWLVDLIGRVRERQLTPEIREGDFRESLADLPDGSVDLILTDPPYGDAAIPSYRHLAEFAARKLKPGGSLLCYTGQSIMPDVYQSLGEHLRYWWTLSLDHTHGGQQLPGKWVMVEWKPIIWYVKDRRSDEAYVADKVRGSRPDKEAHEWAQGIDEVFYLIEQLTSPDGLVVDPFAGSGAFGKAALSLGRRFIGADLDPGNPEGRILS